MVVYGFPIILAIILSIIHYFSEIVSEKVEKYHAQLISVSAGIVITLIFIEIIPELLRINQSLNDAVFLFMLLGFVMFHVSEKFLYQHIKTKKKLMKDLAELHFLGFFIDHFLLGFLLVLAITTISLGFLIFIPLVFHTIASSISLEHIHERTKYSLKSKILLSSSTTIGALIAFFLIPPSTVYLLLFALLTGSLLYISTRDMLPGGKEGNPLYFLVGVLIMILLLLLIKIPV